MNTEVAENVVPKVVIYTSSDCHWCEKAKTYLKQRGVPFSVKDVEVDEAAGREAISLSGQRGTPVITADTARAKPHGRETRRTSSVAACPANAMSTPRRRSRRRSTPHRILCC